jgi:hypothetical protein
MNLELDHFFILTDPGAAVGDLLVSLGIEESFSRDHEGQGTSNRRFPLSNSMLELLWVRDADEASAGAGKKLLFSERANSALASPFGLILTRKDNSSETMPFDGWEYQPDYFDPPMAFHIGDNSKIIREPLCIYVPFMEPISRTVEKGTFKSISNVRISVPVEEMSGTLSVSSTAEGLELLCGAEHLMEITYDNGQSGLTKDLRPTLPLIINW